LARRKREVLDSPSVTLIECAPIFNIGVNRMKEFFYEVVKHEVRWVHTTNGVRVVLPDIMEFAYKGYPKKAIGVMCLEYCLRLQAMRKETAVKKEE
jgi:hypothetical protein